jgi:hypothetical protein
MVVEIFEVHRLKTDLVADNGRCDLIGDTKVAVKSLENIAYMP